ncbi:MAG: acetyl-CoA carboxylase carboxyl transferase subunit beta [candidate division Zixibacteria bacterium 4484_95]|nr:MAG: acetyl-CoA carboxylase carboxyl transferase subunit beta [candidate division Zixibacteria bacterium 4484_95]RKX19262.1 MAG: acetyl-CoA carboxylase carboxyl transferase subunit beta [candidate division Zixibacteria bacterium]
MAWFRKKSRDLSGGEKREIPDGVWTKCKGCGEIITSISLKKNFWTCPKCNYHFRIGSRDYVILLLDDESLDEYDGNLVSADPLGFKDSRKYTDRVADARKKTGLNDAVIAGIGKIDGHVVSFAAMDFNFIGGSMGSVVGEKIARAIERSIKREVPLIIISCSGGARMMEGILSLMQMAKTSALLAKLHKMRIPYISVLTNPTTAGVMASYASLGDVIIAEPQALLGFAGPRVIAQTIGGELPPGFQSSEFFLEHGFLDAIVNRSELKKTLSLLLGYMRVPK